MKFLKDMELNEALAVILSRSETSDILERMIHESEMNYINEKLSCFEYAAIDYQIGTYCYCYMSVKNDWLFLDGVRDSVKAFGGSKRLEACLHQCERLSGSNLFSYMVGRLCDIFFEDEIQPGITYVEDCGSAIYNKEDDSPLLLDAADLFLSNYGEDYYTDDGGEVFHVARLVA